MKIQYIYTDRCYKSSIMNIAGEWMKMKNRITSSVVIQVQNDRIHMFFLIHDS